MVWFYGMGCCLSREEGCCFLHRGASFFSSPFHRPVASFSCLCEGDVSAQGCTRRGQPFGYLYSPFQVLLPCRIGHVAQFPRQVIQCPFYQGFVFCIRTVCFQSFIVYPQGDSASFVRSSDDDSSAFNFQPFVFFFRCAVVHVEAGIPAVVADFHPFLVCFAHVYSGFVSIEESYVGILRGCPHALVSQFYFGASCLHGPFPFPVSSYFQLGCPFSCDVPFQDGAASFHLQHGCGWLVYSYGSFYFCFISTVQVYSSSFFRFYVSQSVCPSCQAHGSFVRYDLPFVDGVVPYVDVSFFFCFDDGSFVDGDFVGCDEGVFTRGCHAPSEDASVVEEGFCVFFHEQFGFRGFVFHQVDFSS